MRKYNLIRPVILIAVALVVKNLVTTICQATGMEEEVAGNVGYFAMIVAGILTFMQLNRISRRPK